MIEPQLSTRIKALEFAVDPKATTQLLNSLRDRGFTGLVLDEATSVSLWDATRLAEFSGAFAAVGVVLHAISALNVAGLLSVGDTGIHAGEVFDLAQALGVHEVRIGLTPSQAAPLRERERVQALAACWRPFAKRAIDLQMRVLWAIRPENDEVNVIDATLHEVDAPNFGILFDTGVMETIAALSSHEHVVEGKPIKGVIGLLERFKGFIGAFELSEPAGGGKLAWERVVPAMVDAWVPSPWWTVNEPDHAAAGRFAQFLTNALANHATRFAKSPSA